MSMMVMFARVWWRRRVVEHHRIRMLVVVGMLGPACCGESGRWGIPTSRTRTGRPITASKMLQLLGGGGHFVGRNHIKLGGGRTPPPLPLLLGRMVFLVCC
jgi:hypothetical protein